MYKSILVKIMQVTKTVNSGCKFVPYKLRKTTKLNAIKMGNISVAFIIKFECCRFYWYNGESVIL